MRNETPETDEVQKTVYEQDGQFYRYRDGLKWSRFQTASAIEGGLLYALYKVEGLSHSERIALIVFAAVLIGFVCVLVILDDLDSRAHLRRMQKFEKLNPYIASRMAGLRAKITAWAVAAILLFNVILLVKFATGL